MHTWHDKNIQIIPIWVLPNIWRLGQVGDTKFLNINVSNKILLNAAKFQGCSFYHFWVIKGKPTGWGGGKITPHPFQIRVNIRDTCASKSKKIFLNKFWLHQDRDERRCPDFLSLKVHIVKVLILCYTSILNVFSTGLLIMSNLNVIQTEIN